MEGADLVNFIRQKPRFIHANGASIFFGYHRAGQKIPQAGKGTLNIDLRFEQFVQIFVGQAEHKICFIIIQIILQSIEGCCQQRAVCQRFQCVIQTGNVNKIHRLEKELFAEYAPVDFDCDDAIIYEWNESREKNLYGHFNFYFGIARDTISKSSMLLYMILLFVVSLLGNLLWALLAPLLGM